MSTPDYDEDDRRTGGFFLALLGGVLLLLVGLFGGWMAFGANGTASPRAAAPQPTPTPNVSVVLPGSQTASQPSSSPAPQVVVGTGQAQASAAGGNANGNGNNGNGNGNGGSNNGHPLTVSGQVTGSVGPGSPASLVITIANPNNQDVLVTSVTGAITSVTTGSQAGKPSCSVSWYHVGSFSGSKAIAKNASGTVSLPVTFDDLSNVNQDNCKGAHYTYSFTVQARQA